MVVLPTPPPPKKKREKLAPSSQPIRDKILEQSWIAWLRFPAVMICTSLRLSHLISIVCCVWLKNFPCFCFNGTQLTQSSG